MGRMAKSDGSVGRRNGAGDDRAFLDDPACPEDGASLNGGGARALSWALAFLLVFVGSLATPEPTRVGAQESEGDPTAELSQAWKLLTAEETPAEERRVAATKLLQAVPAAGSVGQQLSRVVSEEDPAAAALVLVEQLTTDGVLVGLRASASGEGEAAGAKELVDAVLVAAGNPERQLAAPSRGVLVQVLENDEAVAARDALIELIRERLPQLGDDETTPLHRGVLTVLGEHCPRALVVPLTELWSTREDLPAETVELVRVACSRHFQEGDLDLRADLLRTKASYIDALRRLGDWQGLVVELRHPLVDVGLQAADALEAMGATAAFADVTQAILDVQGAQGVSRASPREDELFRRLLSLWRLFASEVEGEGLRQEVERILAALEPEWAPPERLLAVANVLVVEPEVLRDLAAGDPPRAALDALFDCFLADEDPRRRERYVVIFEELGDPRAILRLLELVEPPPGGSRMPPALHARILRSVIACPPEALAGELPREHVLRAAERPESELRLAALQALEHLGIRGDRAYQALLATVRDPAFGNLARAQAARLLGQHDRVEPLLELLAEEEADPVRRQLIMQLGAVSGRLNEFDPAPPEAERTELRKRVLHSLAMSSVPAETTTVRRAALAAAGEDVEALLEMAELWQKLDIEGAANALERVVSPELEASVTGGTRSRAALHLARLLVDGMTPTLPADGKLAAAALRSRKETLLRAERVFDLLDPAELRDPLERGEAARLLVAWAFELALLEAGFDPYHPPGSTGEGDRFELPAGRSRTLLRRALAAAEVSRPARRLEVGGRAGALATARLVLAAAWLGEDEVRQAEGQRLNALLASETTLAQDAHLSRLDTAVEHAVKGGDGAPPAEQPDDEPDENQSEDAEPRERNSN